MVTVLTPQTVIGTPAPVRIEDGLRKWRIQRTIDDPFEFGRIYFPKYWFQKSPAFHEEIMNLAINKSKEDHSNKNLNTLVIAAPRNHSKSTLITFLYVIWSLVTQRKFFTVIISDVAKISVGHTRNIKEEFETNERLCNDWGIILGRDWESLDGAARGEKEKWTDEEFVIGFKKWDKYNNCWSNELDDRAKVLARMANNPLRGLRFGFRRPDLVIADDLENDELVDTPAQRDKLAQWWDSAVEPMIEPPPVGQIILVGTVLHYGSLLNQMLARPDLYVTRRYQAITSQTKEDGSIEQVPLWPERFSMDHLLLLKSKNQLAFQKEYMNDPRDDSNRTFRASWCQWYDTKDLGYKASNKKWYFKGKPLVFYTGVDWSVGKDDQSDFFALVMIGRTPDNDIIVFDIACERLDVANQVNRVIQQNIAYPIQMNGLEGNGFQHELIQQVLRKSLVPVREITHVSRNRKQIRIQGMSPLFEQAKIFLRKCTESEVRRDPLTGEPDTTQGYFNDELRMAVIHPEFYSLYEQLMTYPRSPNDDILDALEMAIETSRTGKRIFDEILVI